MPWTLWESFRFEQLCSGNPFSSAKCWEIIKSRVNTKGATELFSIDELGGRLAEEVEDVIHSYFEIRNISKISFIGFSLGGLIIWAALSKLHKFRHLFYGYTSIASPHLGLKYSQKLISAALTLMNVVKEVQTIKELRLHDSSKIEESYLYHLSEQEGLNWFSHVFLLSSD